MTSSISLLKVLETSYYDHLRAASQGWQQENSQQEYKEFCGKPMIQWAIEAAIESNIFDEIIVSTDDEAIADVSRNLGAMVPFKRSPELSGDFY